MSDAITTPDGWTLVRPQDLDADPYWPQTTLIYERGPWGLAYSPARRLAQVSLRGVVMHTCREVDEAAAWVAEVEREIVATASTPTTED